jgi:rhodanese-related sulfurtransferase
LHFKFEVLNRISAKELKQKIDAQESLFLLDIRENYEREIAHIPSVHVPMGEVPTKATEFPKNEEVIVICRSGRRAEPVAHLLQNDFHFPKVTILDGGLLAWKEQIDPSLDLD